MRACTDDNADDALPLLPRREWDGDDGPFTWDEFVAFYGDDAGRHWVSCSLQRRLDGDEGPFTWAEFVRCYGSEDEAAYWWARGAAAGTVAARGRGLYREATGNGAASGGTHSR